MPELIGEVTKKTNNLLVFTELVSKAKRTKRILSIIRRGKKRDHRKLGKELELFTFSQKVGQGLPLWLPKGAALRERLENFLKKAQKESWL